MNQFNISWLKRPSIIHYGKKCHNIRSTLLPEHIHTCGIFGIFLNRKLLHPYFLMILGKNKSKYSRYFIIFFFLNDIERLDLFERVTLLPKL